MEEDDKGCPMIRMGVSGWMFLLVPGSPGQKAVKRLCVCVCVCACVRACVRVRVCVWIEYVFSYFDRAHYHLLLLCCRTYISVGVWNSSCSARYPAVANMLSIHVIDQLGYVISCYCMLCELSAYCCIDSLIVAYIYCCLLYFVVYMCCSCKWFIFTRIC